MSRVTTRLNAIYYFAAVKGTEKIIDTEKMVKSHMKNFYIAVTLLYIFYILNSIRIVHCWRILYS